MKNPNVFCMAFIFIIPQICLSDTTISPVNPTLSDIVEITVQGEWGSSCIPNESWVDIFGNEIHFVVRDNYPSGVGCLTVMTPWQRTGHVGPLAAGTYTIYVYSWDDLNAPLLPSFTFDVSDKRFVVTPLSLSIDEGSTQTFTVRLLKTPQSPGTSTVSHISGDIDISIQSGTTLNFDSSNYMTHQPLTLIAAEDADPINGSATIQVAAPGYITTLVTAIEADNDIPTILYVDKNATGTGNGAQWSDAFIELTDALSYAAAYLQVQEIRVARGVYTPAEPSGDRNATFQLVNETVTKGGYAGISTSDPDQRNINAFETILSGDLNHNDGIDFTNYDENSFHVVNGANNSVLDGFTISNGHSTGGAGIRIYGYDPTISNCTFKNNLASYGAAIRCYNASPIITNCIFVNNRATRGRLDDGGAIYLSDDGSINRPSPVLTNCTFVANTATESGGAMVSRSACVPVLNNCIFWMNQDGGGIDESSQIHGNFTINHCCIQGWTDTLPATASFGTDPEFCGGSFGDYYLSQLSAGQTVDSPCVNAGNELAVNLSLDQLITRTDNVSDRDIVDLGYHYQTVHIADINRDGRINLKDFAILSAQWQGAPSGPFSADIVPNEGDGIVDLQDFIMFAEHWLDL